MKKTAAAAAAAGGAGLAWLALGPVGRSIADVISIAAGEPGNRWLVVTINCPPQRLSPPDGALPEPIVRLGERAEVNVRPAPGNRGTELGLRLSQPPRGGLPGLVARLSGADPRQELRSALRDAKSLVETGEVIRPDRPSSTHPTPTGRLLDLAIGRAGGEGRL